MTETDEKQAQKALDGEPLADSDAGPVTGSKNGRERVDGTDAIMSALEDSYSDIYDAEPEPAAASAGKK